MDCFLISFLVCILLVSWKGYGNFVLNVYPAILLNVFHQVFWRILWDLSCTESDYLPIKKYFDFSPSVRDFNFISLSKISSTVLSKPEESRHHWLIPDLGGYTLSCSSFSIMLTVDFLF
jgi:hypothetical protein